MNGDILRAAHQFVRQRTAQHFADEAGARTADDDLRDVFELGETQQLRRKIGADQRLRLGAETLRQRDRVVELPARDIVENRTRPFDRHRDPRRVHEIGQPLGRAHHDRRNRVGPDAGQNALARGPGALDRLSLHALDQRRIDAFGGAAQREFAQRRQVLRLEEILDGARGRFLHIDLALGETLEQFVGREIDKNDLVRLVENAVRHGLAHADLADLLDDVVEAFEMLDVQRGPYINAGRQQFVDILPALGVAAAGHVGMGIFVDQQQVRPPRQCGVDVEFAHHLVAIDDRLARQYFEPAGQLLGFAPAMGLDQAGDDIAAALDFAAGGGEHGKGLADAGCGAQKYLQPPAPLLLGEREQRIR